MELLVVKNKRKYFMIDLFLCIEWYLFYDSKLRAHNYYCKAYFPNAKLHSLE